MGNTIQTNDGRYYQKQGFGVTAAGIAAASAAGSALGIAQIPVTNYLTGKMSKISQSIDTAEIRNGLSDALKKSGLDGKVKINEVTPSSGMFSFMDFVPNKLKQNKAFKYIFESCDITGAIKNGKNAGFSNISNEILINTEKMGAAGFHEIGHAINFNKSKFWKAMQLLRNPSVALPAIFISIALFKRKKVEGEKPEGFLDKTTTFIKDNVGKLSVGAMIPVIAEELMATKRGNSLAKQLLSPENFKKVVKTNRFGAVSYIGGALFIGVSAYLLNKIKDAVSAPKEVKLK